MITHRPPSFTEGKTSLKQENWTPNCRLNLRDGGPTNFSLSARTDSKRVSVHAILQPAWSSGFHDMPDKNNFKRLLVICIISRISRHIVHSREKQRPVMSIGACVAHVLESTCLRVEKAKILSALISCALYISWSVLHSIGTAETDKEIDR